MGAKGRQQQRKRWGRQQQRVGYGGSTSGGEASRVRAPWNSAARRVLDAQMRACPPASSCTCAYHTHNTRMQPGTPGSSAGHTPANQQTTRAASTSRYWLRGCVRLRHRVAATATATAGGAIGRTCRRMRGYVASAPVNVKGPMRLPTDMSARHRLDGVSARTQASPLAASPGVTTVVCRWQLTYYRASAPKELPICHHRNCMRAARRHPPHRHTRCRCRHHRCSTSQAAAARRHPPHRYTRCRCRHHCCSTSQAAAHRRWQHLTAQVATRWYQRDLASASLPHTLTQTTLPHPRSLLRSRYYSSLLLPSLSPLPPSSVGVRHVGSAPALAPAPVPALANA